MNDREYLIFICGYLKGILHLNKIPSQLLHEIVESIKSRKKGMTEEDRKAVEDAYATHDNETYSGPDDDYYDRVKEHRNSLMEGYDHDSDYDQQSPNFWG